MCVNPDMAGRRLVVTGAARGIGEKLARLAAARGARLAALGLEPDRFRNLADEAGATRGRCPGEGETSGQNRPNDAVESLR
jgi:NAD(P)-dependent dehydrogenase (short-subunit alcohol dehydrogenase family)